MVDGIDGSGKSTIINFWKEYLTEQGNALFDLKDRWKETGQHPSIEELRSYDFVLSGEPTYVGIGKAIRDELIRNGTNYPPLAIAEAYSLDRLILYTKLIIPAINDNKCVIQDRGVSTSLCYQALTGELTVETIAALPGNALTLEHRPDHLVIIQADPEMTLARLATRHEKQDNVIFEHLAFQQKAAARFASPEYRALFESRGTKVHYLQNSEDIAIIKEQANTLLKHILTS